jgi:tRNA(Arg) A34 adenosine deaminase TadA
MILHAISQNHLKCALKRKQRAIAFSMMPALSLAHGIESNRTRRFKKTDLRSRLDPFHYHAARKPHCQMPRNAPHALAITDDLIKQTKLPAAAILGRKGGSSGYGRYLPDFVLYSTHEPCAMCTGACVWSKIGAVVFGVSQEDITAYGNKHGTEKFKWRACLISCKFVLEKGGLHIPVFDSFLKLECQKLFRYRASQTNPSRSS